MQDLKTALKILEYCVSKGKKHQFYDMNVKDADFYTAIVTDNDMQDDIVRNQFPSEVDGKKDMPDMERRLTTPKIGTSTSATILRPYNVIDGLHPKTYKLECTNDNETEELQNAIQNWNNTQNDLLKYLSDSLLHFNVTDANSLLVIDIESFDSKNEKPTCNSWFANSKNVFNYRRKNNLYEWVLLGYNEYHNELELVRKKRFVYFNDNVSIVLEELDKDDIRNDLGIETVTLDTLTTQAEKSSVEFLTAIDGNAYYLRINTHNLGIVPVLNISNKKAIPNVDVFCSLFYSVRNLAVRLIVRNTEEEMMFRNHASPTIFEYREDEPDDFGVDDCDDNGCGNCHACHRKGAYKKGDVRGGTQKLRTFTMPMAREDMIDISTLRHEFAGDIKSVEYFKNDVSSIKAEMYRVLYGTELIDKEHTVKTATENHIISSKEAEAVHKYLDNVINVTKKAVQIIAKYLNIAECNVNIRFPYKLQADTLDELYLELEKARKASNVTDIKEITNRIIEAKYKDEPNSIIQEKTWSCLNPVYYQTFAEKMQTIALSLGDSEALSENERYLAIHYNNVRCYIETYYPNFYDLDIKRQMEILNIVIDEQLSENTNLDTENE